MTRSDVIRKLENNYKGQYGEFKWYAGQTFVFKDKDIAYKTLLIRDLNDKISGKNLYIKVPQVYEGDTESKLNKVINGLTEEIKWYEKEYGRIPGLNMPSEEYSICNDPMESGNKTVLISTKWIDNIKGDIFRLDSNQLYKYITDYPEFKNTLIQFAIKTADLAKKRIYPDITGIDNVAIYLDDNIPKIALIDRHIISINKYSTDETKAKIDSSIEKLEKFLEDPLNLKNIQYLTNGEFV